MGKHEPLGYALLVKPEQDKKEHHDGGGVAVYSAVHADDAAMMMPRPQRRKSICLYVILGLLAFVAFTAMTVATCGYFFVRHQVRRFTVTEPVKFPIQEMPQEDLQVMMDRAELFFDELVAGNDPQEDLIVTVDELNGLVAQSDYLRGNVIFNVETDKISVDMSLPANGLPGGKGRYFVASGYTQMKTLPDDTTETATVLDIAKKIEGVDGPLMQADVHVFEDEAGEWVVNVLSGAFLDVPIPQDWIDQKENILDHMDDCSHGHGHHHHHHGHRYRNNDYDDDSHHHHHHHHRGNHHPDRHHGHHGDEHHHHHRHDDDHDHHIENVKKVLHGIAGIQVADGEIIIRARHADETGAVSVPSNSSTVKEPSAMTAVHAGGNNRNLRGLQGRGRASTTSSRSTYSRSMLLVKRLLF